nr:hypothetical protein CFP56_47859 [Quercus suber]
MEGQNWKKERASEGWFRDLRISEASVGVRGSGAAGICGIWYGDDRRGVTSAKSEQPVGEVEVTLAMYFVA